MSGENKTKYQTVDFGDYLYVSEDSPSGLRWKIDRYRGKTYNVLATRAGDVAGWKDRKHWSVKLHNHSFAAHRIVYLLSHGSLDPVLEIDHVDGDGFNNKPKNLRQVLTVVNMRNKPKRSDSKTGVTGVQYNEHMNDSGSVHRRFKAVWIAFDGKRCSRYFSCNKFGYEEAFRLACEYRAEKIEELNRHGAGYTERHGT